jgi:hypothetical protein
VVPPLPAVVACVVLAPLETLEADVLATPLPPRPPPELASRSLRFQSSAQAAIGVAASAIRTKSRCL